ncbi:hypothetical protein B0H63DRAFT_505415 [Podospora didyma]|uniref:Uncharacterized protein n=1 Tax=Podospora didyma TaxID=330526 RepID=A0AAE0P4Y1_9PEZI|nr:hypothetical protein B0H63DRAFT_505415 [Podospora didyma]
MKLSPSSTLLFSSALCLSLFSSAVLAAPADTELFNRETNSTLERRCNGKINGYTQNSDCTGDFFEWTNLCDAGCVTNIDGNGNPTPMHSLYTYSSVNNWHIRVWSGPYCTGSILDNWFSGEGCRGHWTIYSYSFV